MEGIKDGCDVIVLSPPHKDPSGTVLYVLELLKAPARSPDEESVAVVEPRGDEGMYPFFNI